ncbi:MAG: NAD(P)H-dependent oxidoreductase [Thermodesulfovibrionales bacterium]|nr:NAD(P)H-dependent oxidoreductase [Thermodesulfovibrionales bacterium]
MKQLIVFCHPNPMSFCSAIKSKVVEVYQSFGDEIVVRDLYQIGFDPVLKGKDFEALKSGVLPEDIKTEQEFIKNAEIVTFIYPIWWTGLPAMVKGYIDRIFLYGFAYALDENKNVQPLLKGKKAIIINTSGSPNEYYDNIGMTNALMMTSDKGIFEFCGFEVLLHKIFGAVPYVDNNTRKEMLEQIPILIKENRR